MQVLIFELYDKWKLQYKAFCAGSIITNSRVLTSANCFLTNRKRYKKNLSHVRAVAGIVHTLAKEPIESSIQQWRTIVHLYSQKFFRFPAFDLAILQVNKPYVFNQFVSKINYATLNQDYDGVCMSTAVRAVTSWSINKYVYLEEMKLVPRRRCERRLLRSCHTYYCTSNDPYLWRADPEIQGGGLICFDTGDPAETDKSQGLLVGVTSLVNSGLPDLHTRVGVFNKWVTDDCVRLTPHNAIHFVWLFVLYVTPITLNISIP